MEAKVIGTEEARHHLGKLVDAAHYQEKVAVITKNGEPRAVLISHARHLENEELREKHAPAEEPR